MKTYLSCLGLFTLLFSGSSCSPTLTEIGANTGGNAGEATGGNTTKFGTGGATSRGGTSGKGGSATGGTTSRTSTSPTGCTAFPQTITWDWNGGEAAPYFPYESPATLSATGFSYVARTRDPATQKTVEHACNVAIDCAAWAPELALIVPRIAQMMAFSTVKVTFGIDSRLVDGQVFVLRDGVHEFIIGEDCGVDASCNPIPTEFAELKAALLALESHAMLTCAPECHDPVAPLSCVSGGAAVWYHEGTGCYKLDGCQCSGTGCPTLYASEEDCRLANAYCPRYQSCGNSSTMNPSCDSDEFCSFPLHDAQTRNCGSTDAAGICLPQPHACAAPSLTSSICACTDGEVYASECEAALQRKAPGPLGQCAIDCQLDTDCGKFGDFCALYPAIVAEPATLSPRVGKTPVCVDGLCACK